MSAIELNEGNFEELVLQSEKPVLVDFWAVWCGPCGMMAPVVEQIAEEQEGRLVVGKLDCEKNEEIAGKYGITGIPAFLIFKNGEVVDRIMGAMPKGELMAVVEKYL